MNAIRHTPADGVVSITGRVVDGGVELAVCDGCGGIPEDDLPHVFDVAWRGTRRPHTRDRPVTRHRRRPRPGHRQGDRRGPRGDGQGRQRVPRLPLPGPAARMRVLVTGSAGFIGGAVCSALEAAGRRRRPGRRHAAARSRRHRPPPGTHRLDVRDAAAGGDLLGRRRRRVPPGRLVGAGVRVGDLPRTPPTTTSARPPCCRRCTTPGVRSAGARVVDGRLRRGRYTCPEHGDQVPPPAHRVGARGRRLRQPLPRLWRRLGLGLVDEDARLDPRSAYAASKVAQEHYASAWVRQAEAAGCCAALPQRLRPRNASGHAVLRGGGDVPVLARARRAAASSRTAARCGTSCTSPTSRPPTSRRCEAVESAECRTPTTWPPASRSRSGPSPSWSPAASGRTWHRRSPVASGSGTSGTSSPPRACPGELGFVAAVAPTTGLARLRHGAAALSSTRSPGRVRAASRTQGRPQLERQPAPSPRLRQQRGARAAARARTAARSAPPRPCSCGTGRPDHGRDRGRRRAGRRRGRPDAVPWSRTRARRPAAARRSGRGRRGSPTSSTSPGGRLRGRPSSGPSAPGTRPTRRIPAAAKASTTAAALGGDDRSGRQVFARGEHRECEQRQQRQPVGEQQAVAEEQAGQRRPADRLALASGGGGERERGQSPGRDRREHGVRETAMPDARPARGRGTALRAGQQLRREARGPPSARPRTVLAARTVTTSPAAKSPPSPIRTRPTKNSSAPGGWPATCVVQLSRWDIGIRSTKPVSRAWTSVTPRAVRRYSSSLSSTREMPGCRPRTRARAATPAPRRRRPGAGGARVSRADQSAAYLHASSARTSAGTVPGPRSRGSQLACSGGTERCGFRRACTSQPVASGTMTAAARAGSAIPSPTHGATRTATGWRVCNVVAMGASLGPVDRSRADSGRDVTGS